MTDWADEKARQIIPCPENPDSKTAENICPFSWNSCRRANKCEAIDECAAALREARAMGSEWRVSAHDPMPTDGTKILAALHVTERVRNVTERVLNVTYWQMDVVWFDQDSGCLDLECEFGWEWQDYTHWMPLPAAPKES